MRKLWDIEFMLVSSANNTSSPDEALPENPPELSIDKPQTIYPTPKSISHSPSAQMQPSTL